MGLSHSPSIVTNGLVLCLDAGNRKSYPGIGTAWTDLVSSGIGTIFNGPTYNSSNGGSLVFDTAGQSYTTSLITTTFANTTQSIWFKWSGVNVTGTIIYLGNSGSNGLGLYIGSSGTPSNQLGVLYGGVSFNALPSSVTLTTNWSNFVVTRSSNTTTLYQNGSLFTSTTNAPATSASYPFSGNVGGVGGNISNISFYNRALTLAEIQQNYNALRGRFGV